MVSHVLNVLMRTFYIFLAHILKGLIAFTAGHVPQ